jgi:hypothetical protein
MSLEWPYLWRAVAGMALAGLVLAFLGPYGTYAMPLGRRLVFWELAVPGVGTFIMAVLWLLRQRLTPTWPDLAIEAAAAVLGAVPAMGWIRLLDLTVGSGQSQPLGFLYFSILVVSLVLTPLVDRFALAAKAPAQAPPPGSDAADSGAAIDAAAAFLLRYAPKLAGSRLLALEAEDHYLRIHADGGSELVLLRMRDAVAALEGVPGRQVHRSFWVAETAVRAIRRDGARLVLELENGLEVPVSRTNAASLREAGWLDRVRSDAL